MNNILFTLILVYNNLKKKLDFSLIYFEIKSLNNNIYIHLNKL